MNVTKNGITISIDDSEVIRLALLKLNAEDAKVLPAVVQRFRIGTHYEEQGGVYAGITRSEDRSYEYHLFVGPEADSAMNWNNAVAWTNELKVNSSTDFALPRRNEQSLMFANVPELFKKEWYWSGVQLAGNSDYAWGQGFNNGYQSYWFKDCSYRVRAVRRLIIQ